MTAGRKKKEGARRVIVPVRFSQQMYDVLTAASKARGMKGRSELVATLARWGLEASGEIPLGSGGPPRDGTGAVCEHPRMICGACFTPVTRTGKNGAEEGAGEART